MAMPMPVANPWPNGPVVVSTPMDDGTVKHIIQGGQSLWTIAAVYGIDLETLREINDLEPDAIMNLGDEVIIQAPGGKREYELIEII